MANNIKISVIIVNWNGRHHLEECLNALYAQTFKDFEIIVVDNGSIDGTVSWLQQNYPKVRIAPLSENKGFCHANNLGYVISKGQFIVLLNNDTKADLNWLYYLFNQINTNERIGICASRIVRYDDSNILDTAGDGYDISGVGFRRGNGENVNKFNNKIEEVYGACAAAAIYRKSMLQKIGFFDEDFFAVGEDIDLSFRAKMAGFKCIYVPQAVVQHKVSETIGVGSDFQIYQARRNVEYVYFKNMPTPLLILTFPLHLLYNLLTLIQALAERRMGIYLKAKKDFFHNFSKVMNKRTEIQKQRKISLISLLNSFSKNYLFEKSISEVCGNRNGYPGN